MKIYNTQEEVTADIKDNVLAIEGDATFNFSLSINASIVAKAGDIKAREHQCREHQCREHQCRGHQGKGHQCREHQCRGH